MQPVVYEVTVAYWTKLLQLAMAFFQFEAKSCC